jgi:hypothetical protein
LLFGDRLNLHPAAFMGELVALAAIVSSVIFLSRSPLVQDPEPESTAAPVRPTVAAHH